MMETNRVLIGDSAVVLATFPDACIDLTVTSPPYDNLRTYKGFTFDFEAIARQLYRVTKPGGVVVWVVNDSMHNGSETGTSFRQALFFKECGFNLHDTMFYEKKNFSAPESARYHQLIEYMFVFSVGAPKTFNPIKDKRNIGAGKSNFGINTKRRKDGTMREDSKKIYADFGMRGNVWRMNTAGQENVCEPLLHPAQFPEALARDHILSWSNPGDVVLDPFAGSGTTLKAAMQLERQYIGIEISAEYVNDIILPRLNGTTAPLPMFAANSSCPHTFVTRSDNEKTCMACGVALV